MIGVASALVLACLAVGVRGVCPNGFFRHGQSCYLVPRHVASWAEAKTYCQAVGADLAELDTPEEQTVLSTYLQNHRGTYPSGKFWLDGQDYVEEGQWVWARTGRPVTGQWHPGEPDNLNDQHCLDFLDRTNILLDDDHCEDRNNFICEIFSETLQPEIFDGSCC